MGVNLVPIVRDFSIDDETFAAGSGSVIDGCVTPGTHRVMRFDFLSHNIGDADLAVGNPDDHPDWFVWSAGHGHWHLKDFNEFLLFDATGNQAATGYKQAFCLVDIEHPSSFGPASAQFTDCNTNQGVSSGWADLYHKSLDCQFLIIDGLPDGDYTLLSTTNAQKFIPEDTFDNNTICTGLRIQGNNVTEIDPPIYIAPYIAAVNFNSVPETETGLRAAVFEVRSCRAVTIRFVDGPNVLSGPPGTTFERFGDPVVVLPATNTVETRFLRLWMTYVGTNAGDMATGTVKIGCDQTGEEFDIPITADTIQRPTSVTVLSLDQSNSMSFDSGISPDIKRGDVLKFSAPPFMDVIQDDNAIGIVGFDHDPHTLMPVEPVVPNGRFLANGTLSSYTSNPNGWTSIGEGVARAHDLLAAESGYDIKAIVVLTDGKENHDAYDRRYIADVADLINERVYAIGLGTVENIQPSALQDLCAGHEGFLLMTGNLNPDAYFRVAKYYQQILAGVQNHEIVRDPEGFVGPGQKHRIPFVLNETDISCTVVLLSPAPNAIKFLIETPEGKIIDPSLAFGTPSITFVMRNNVSYYRFTLPVPVADSEAREGTWHAVLTIDDKYFKRYRAHLEKNTIEYTWAHAHGVRYSLNVQAYSNLRMRARLSQDGYEPGATLTLRAVLTEYGLPVASRAKVHAALERPDKTTTMLTLSEAEPGVFETTIGTSMSGIYHIRVLANGSTLRKRDFTREQLLTGAVWKGGNDPRPTGDDPREDRKRLCRLLACLLAEKVLGKYLAHKGVDVKVLAKCLREYCKDSQQHPITHLAQLHPQLAAVLADPQVRAALAQVISDDGPFENH